MTTEPITTPKPRRRWLQFNLRTLMFVALAGGVSCAWFAERMNHARRQRENVRFVRELGGYEFYDSQMWADGSIPLMAPKVARLHLLFDRGCNRSWMMISSGRWCEWTSRLTARCPTAI